MRGVHTPWDAQHLQIMWWCCLRQHRRVYVDTAKADHRDGAALTSLGMCSSSTPFSYLAWILFSCAVRGMRMRRRAKRVVRSFLFNISQSAIVRHATPGTLSSLCMQGYVKGLRRP